MSGRDAPVPYRDTPDGVSFWIHVTPGARWESIGGAHGDALRVRVTEPPADGAANRACQALLARAFEIGRGDVTLDAASKGRRKRVRIQGDAARLARRLAALAAGDRGGL